MKNKPPGPHDNCQTPGYAINLLLDHITIPEGALIWEPAVGEGYLLQALEAAGYQAIGTDIQQGQDYFYYDPPQADLIITNPPFSIKPLWVDRTLEIGLPAALLMPLAYIGTRAGHRLAQAVELEILVPDTRIDFKMPNKGWRGSAQFATAWYTWGLGLGTPLKSVRLEKPR